jgi:uncharacterized coiled-coil DUF342 family protein
MMVQAAPHQFASAKTETEVAVLQVQVENINEKVDEVKSEMKDLRTSLAEESKQTRDLITTFQDDNTKAHKEMASKITALEKWRWMIMGAGIALGAVGFEVVGKIFGM